MVHLKSRADSGVLRVMHSFPPDALESLPLGTVCPRGWLRAQLQAQADGLTGHLDEFWPSVADSRWIGGNSEGWERGPYWLDGLVPLAFLLDDARLQAKAQKWIDTILEHQHEDGWLGSKEDAHAGSGLQTLDPWPLAVLFKAFAQWQEATGDARIVPAMARAMRRIGELIRETPLDDWAKSRWFELTWGVRWLYRQTGEAWLLDLARTIDEQGFDWAANWENFTFTSRPEGRAWTHQTHVVNNAMALKEAALSGRRAEDGSAGVVAERAWRYIATLDRYHGQAHGAFSGDECLAGRNPSQGTELCAIVEYLFSLEVLLAASGDARFGDRLESIAFNALPATMTPDCSAHQYDQQVNQVLVSQATRDWVSNGNDSNLFGLEPNFGCCLANMHQGWPKLATHAWLRRDAHTLCAAVLLPCAVTVEIDGVAVEIEEETEYPWRGQVVFKVRAARPVRFALEIRIPSWAQGARLAVGDETFAAEPDGFARIEREWHGEDAVLELPMELHVEERTGTAVSLWRGPLLFGLRIEEEFHHLRGEKPFCDWEVHPQSAWNYALVRSALESAEVVEAAVPALPFDAAQPPVRLKVKAQPIEWGQKNNSAAAPPENAAPQGESQMVELVPYGSTHLRIAEFPVVG